MDITKIENVPGKEPVACDECGERLEDMCPLCEVCEQCCTCNDFEEDEYE